MPDSESSPTDACQDALARGEPWRGLLPGPLGDLDAFLEPAARAPGPVAVVCHPNPRAGGTMGHKVVQTAAKAMRAAGIHSLRFNYRGVGKSAGEHGVHGEEREDVRAMLAHARDFAAPRSPLFLAGFSFGTWVGLPEGEVDPRVAAMVAIGMPLDARDFPYPLGEGAKPLLIVQGRADEFARPESVEEWARRRPGETRLVFLECGHFFHGRLEELESAIVEFIQSRRE